MNDKSKTDGRQKHQKAERQAKLKHKNKDMQ